ncbi:hypothetical protein CSOJ01_13742 [Colletotrichum sojae]|uniref:Uncharacterized protein n=1 Tax=Colletotrichum sojae TaxID=2175907 RepID=A0A8H6MK79_9PEZI|nr:hypothetical protein CSOJ01_13742 [Colletotrichum sojae]
MSIDSLYSAGNIGRDSQRQKTDEHCSTLLWALQDLAGDVSGFGDGRGDIRLDVGREYSSSPARLFLWFQGRKAGEPDEATPLLLPH